MRKITYFLIFFSSFAFSQNSILYEISGNGLKHNSYLFGTLHVQDEAAFSFNDSVFWAIDQAEVAAFELDFDLKKTGMEYDESKIEKLFEYIAAEVIPAVMEAVPADSMASKIIKSIVPVYRYILTSQFSGENKRTSVVDQYLQDYSRSKGKEIMGIETYSEQINAILGDDYSGLKEGILEMFTTEGFFENLLDYPGNLNGLIEAYANLDYQSICSQIEEVGDLTNPFASAFYDRIFTDRNELMVQRTKNIIKENSVFIAVGCGHLCGSNGLVQQYRDLGYTVRPIDLTGKKAGLGLKWERVEFATFSTELPMNSKMSEEGEINMYGYNPPISSQEFYTSKGKLQFMIKLSKVREDYESYDVIEPEEQSDDYVIDIVEEEINYQHDENEYRNVNPHLKQKLQVEGDSIFIHEKQYIEESDEWVYHKHSYSTEEYIMSHTVDASYDESADDAIEYDDAEIDWAADDVEVVYEDGYPDGPTRTETEYEEEEEYEMEIEEYEEPKKRMRPDDYITEEMKAYFDRVGEIIKAEFEDDKESFSGMAQMSMFAVSTDTLNIKIMGEMQEVYRSHTAFSHSIMFSLSAENGIEYQFSITGDPEAIKSEEVLRFLNSIEIKQ